MKKIQDIISVELVSKFKEQMHDLCMRYNMLIDNEAMHCRENNQYEIYSTQYLKDLYNISEMRNAAQKIVDLSNELNFKISTFPQYRKDIDMSLNKEDNDSSVNDDMDDDF